ncbi:MAG: hypothetical protein J6S14_11620 [Clostridia bacterium]|nr:hypothetical protein [Clostridia bacterium]
MEKTLKQIADEFAPGAKSAGLKQKLYRYASRAGIEPTRTDDKGTKYYTDEALERLREYAAEQESPSSEQESPPQDQPNFNFIYDQIAIKDEQIADLNAQIRLLHETIATLSESLKAAQVIQAQTIQALSPPQKAQDEMNADTHINTTETQENATESHYVEKKGILSWFKRK